MSSNQFLEMEDTYSSNDARVIMKTSNPRNNTREVSHLTAVKRRVPICMGTNIKELSESLNIQKTVRLTLSFSGKKSDMWITFKVKVIESIKKHKIRIQGIVVKSSKPKYIRSGGNIVAMVNYAKGGIEGYVSNM